MQRSSFIGSNYFRIEERGETLMSQEQFNAIKDVKCQCGTMVSKYRVKQGRRRCGKCERQCINDVGEAIPEQKLRRAQ